MTPFSEWLLLSIEAGYVPGPGQFLGLVRELLADGLIAREGSKVLDMGVGPEISVPVYGVTLAGRAVVETP